MAVLLDFFFFHSFFFFWVNLSSNIISLMCLCVPLDIVVSLSLFPLSHNTFLALSIFLFCYLFFLFSRCFGEAKRGALEQNIGCCRLGIAVCLSFSFIANRLSLRYHNRFDLADKNDVATAREKKYCLDPCESNLISKR